LAKSTSQQSTANSQRCLRR